MVFENKIYEGIHYSRFVASFWKSGGRQSQFKYWLRTLIINGKPIPDDVVRKIYNYGTNGKLELEMHSKMFVNS